MQKEELELKLKEMKNRWMDTSYKKFKEIAEEQLEDQSSAHILKKLFLEDVSLADEIIKERYEDDYNLNEGNEEGCQR